MRPAFRSFLVLFVFVLAFAVTATAFAHTASTARHHKKKKLTAYTNPHLAPTASAGLFTGYPTYSSEWHGCSKQAIYTIDPDVSILPSAGVTAGNAQKAITFTPTTTRSVSWVANPGWKICGVEANGTLSNPNVKDLLLAGFGFTSLRTSGSTDAGLNIQVKIPVNSINRKDYKEFEGKTYSIAEVVDVIVWVKKG